MSDEVRLPMELTIAEAAVIKLIRNSTPFSNITIIKRDGKIERTMKEESQTIKDVAKEQGLLGETIPLDKDTENDIVEKD